MSNGMPSARGGEWKGRETKEARGNWYRNYDRIFKKEKEDEVQKEAGSN